MQMADRAPRRGGIRARAIVVYAATALLSLVLAAWVLQLPRADLHVPFAYSADAVFLSMSVKGIHDNGWYLTNRFVGMPTGLELHDYVTADNLHFLALKLLVAVSGDYAVAVNVYYLMLFPLTALAALFAFRRFGISYGSGMVAALLFTVLPYRFQRGETHLFLAAYFLVPLIVMVCLQVFRWGEEGSPEAVGGRERGFWPAAALICVLVASSGIYYAVYGAGLLMLAGAAAAAHRGRVRPLVVACGLVALIAAGVLANAAPSLLYRLRHAPNREAVTREARETEVYGLKITQLLLPVTGHRWAPLRGVKDHYNREAPLVTENDSAALGVIGAIGFVVLIAWLFVARPGGAGRGILAELSLLNLACVLFGTVGGFGTFIAFTLSPALRSHTRISVFIAFLSLFAVACCLDSLRRRMLARGRSPLLARVLLADLLVLGVLDQGGTFVPDYRKVQAEYRSDRDFIQRIEAELPPDAMIFQLPYAPFPENGTVVQMPDYEQFKGYLHSHTLRWSYGAMRGRDADRWQRGLAGQAMPRVVAELSRRGFQGITVDRRGYVDRGAAIERELTRLLEAQPLVSRDGTKVFLPLAMAGTGEMPAGGQPGR